MKKSYLFTSTLIAAVALSVPAFALDGEGTSGSPYYGTIQGSEIFSTSDTTTIYVGTESAALGGDNTNSYFAGHSSETYYVSNIHINAGGIYITNGNGGDYHYYSGTITGTGDWTVTYVEGASDNSGNTDVTQRYSFTGDLSGWTGNFKIYTVDTGDYVYYGNGNVAATNTNISGNGGSISVDFGEVQYNYTGYAEGTSASALTVTNSSIEAHKVTFTGSVNYEVSSTITGWDGSGYNKSGTTETKAENSTLTISNTGTTTFSGSVSNFDIVTVGASSTLAIGSGGSLDLSGATVNISSTIQNAGAITIDSSTSFVIDSSVSHTGWSDGSATYTLIASGGTIESYADSISVSVSNIYNVIVSNVSCENNTLTVTLTDNAEASGLHGTGESDNPYYTTGTSGTSIPTSIFTGAGTTVYLASETQSLGNSSDNIYWSESVNAACDIVIGAAGIYLTNGSGNNVHTFSGKISGEGDWTVSHTSSAGSGVAQYYVFTGDLSQWSGSFTIDTTNTGDYVHFGNGGQAATNTAISGTGAVAVDYGTVQYNYSGYADDTATSLTVTNSSIEGHKVTFTGSVNYEVSANLTGYDANGATGSTLEISTKGTVTASGSISNFDIVTVKGNSTLAIAESGSLDLSSTTVNIGSTIQNSGSITIDTSTSFVLDDSMTYTGDWTSTDGATYTLISGSGTIYIGTTELTSDNVSSSLSLENVSSSSVTISEATFSYVDGTLSVTVKGNTAPLGSTASNPYTGAITDLDLSTWAAGSTVYISGITSGYFANSGTNAMSIVADINISYAEEDENKNGLSLNNAYSDVIYTFSGKITGDGNWTFNGGTGATPTQHYIFTGDVSNYSGNFSLTAGTNAKSEGYLEFGDGGQAATNTNVSGTGSITTSTNFAVIFNYGSLAEGTGEETAITIGNTSITTADLQFAGSVDYIVSADTTITSASSSGSFTVSTQGTVTILGTLTTGSDSNAFSSLSVAEGSTLRIGADNTFYMDTTSTSGDVFVVSGTLEVAEGVSFTVRKRTAATNYSIANLSLENGSSFVFHTEGQNAPGAANQGLAIGALTVTGSATMGTDYWQNYVTIGTLVSSGTTGATLTLTSSASSSVATIYELTGTGTSSFTGTIDLTETNSSTNAARGVTLIISSEKAAAGAVIDMGTDNSSYGALALGVNAEKVEIAGLTSTSTTGGDIVYSGAVSAGAALGNAGATLIDYGHQTSGSGFDNVSTSRNTLVINTAENATYSFSGVIMDMLNLEKTGEGTQSITFQTSQYGTVGYYFDGSIAVTEGTLNLSGVETNSAGITVAKDATLNIANHITLAATSDITSVSSTISGTLSIESGGQLDLTGTVTINNAISNSGTITIADSTSIVVGVEVQTGEYSGTNYDYYTLIDGSNGSGSVTLDGSVTFVINGAEITLSNIDTLADGDTDWKGYISGGSLYIYAETSTTAQTADNLTWAGTDGNNTWSTSESNTPWSDTESGSSGYYFQNEANVTFGPNTDGSLSATVVLGENITAGTVNITGSGYTLTASDTTNGNTLTATSIILDDEETDGDTHTFTIAQGVTVTAGTLTETAGQLDLVVNGELNVTTMTVTTTQDESISGSGKLTVGTLEYSSDHGVSLTISVAEATFGSITEESSGAETNGNLRHLIFGDGTSTTTASVTSMEIKGLSEVQVAEGSELTITNLVDSSGWNTTISGDGSIKIGSMTVSGNATSATLNISIANFESGAITFSGTVALTISSASFTADSIKFTGGNDNDNGAGAITISGSTKATIGAIESAKTHTITIANGGELTTGEIYRSGSTLKLVVDGTLTVDQLSGYGDGGTTTSGMLYFGKSTDSGTNMAQTLSGTGTANVYGIEANLGNGSLTISVTNLNIGAGGITRYGSGTGTVTINGTEVGLYNTTASEISANMTIGTSGVTFNPESEGQTITLSGAVTGNGLVTKTGAGELAFTGTGSTLTKGLTVSAGTVSVATEASLTLGGTVTLASSISNSGTITIADSTSFVLDNLTMGTGGGDGNRDYYVLITGNGGTVTGSVTIDNFTLTEGSLDGWTLWDDGLNSGYLVIYGEAQAEVSNLTWAGTENSYTWNTSTDNTIWKNADEESVAFTTGSNVTFGDNAENKSVVLGEDIEAGEVKITGSGYTLTASDTENGNTLTATSIVLDDEETDGGAHTFTIGEGVTVTATTLTESAGQLDLVVDGSLNVTDSMHIDSSENEVISGSGRIEVKNFTYDAAQGSSLTITVSEFSFSDFVEKPSGEDNASSDAYRTLIIGSEDGVIPDDAWYSTEVSGAYAEISGKSEVRVNKNSMFGALAIHNYSDYDLLISGEGLFYANEFDLAGTGKLIISCAEVEAGVVYNSKENIVINEGGQLAVGDFKHTTIVESDDDVYTEGLLNLQVDGTFIVDMLEDYVNPTGTLSFGTEDSTTTLEGSHSISGKGTANIYKLEYGADGAGLEISVANLNIGAGGISAAAGASSLVLDGVTVGVYAGIDEENTNTSWSTEANLTLKNGVTFNTEAGESITLAGVVATDSNTEGSSLTKTGEGTLTLAGEATLSGLTVSAGTLSVATGASLTLAGNNEVDIQLNGGMLAIAQGATVSSGSGVKTSVTISDGGQLSLGNSVSLNVDVMNIVLSTANYDESNTGSGTFAIVGDSTSSLTLTDSAAITITVDSALETLLSGEGTYYFDISDGISDLTLDWSALTRYGTVSYTDGVLSVFVGAIPEPELFSIFFGIGAVGLMATRRRKRRVA